jgi:hypothetical protein
MNVLVACEYSGRVRDAFIKKGHKAISCDLLESDLPGTHYQGNIFDLDFTKFDLLIAHPPCTYLCNSGVSHLHKDAKRWLNLFDGALFFKRLLNAPVKKVAVENPVMHKYAKTLIGNVDQTQVIQPYMFGHMEQKATCLWLKNLPPLKPTNLVKDEMLALPRKDRERLYFLLPSKERAKLRSLTYQGIADAMAEQWG